MFVFVGDEMTTEAALNNIDHQDLLADRAYSEIRSAIFARKLMPGAALSVPKLAQQLGVSRTPVREAVQRLVATGLAISVSHRGAVVSDVGIEDLRHIYDVRESLEALAARRATERLDQPAQENLQSIIERHRKSLDREEGVAAHIELDMQFHKQIRELAANQYLTAFLGVLQGQIHLAMHSLWRSDDAPHQALQEHQKIMAAILDNDPDAAEATTRAHIGRIRSQLTECEDYRE